MKKLLTLFASFLLIFAFATSGYAGVIFNDWTLNLTGIENQTSAITNIDQILVHGIGWSQTSDVNSSGQPDGGDIGSTDGLYNSLTYWNTGGGTQSWGNNLELTFSVSFNSLLTDPVGSGWTHLAAGTDISTLAGTDLSNIQRDGLLTIYADDYSDGSGANTSTGDGYEDGTKIAVFKIVAGDGGSFDLDTYDGHDDATYELVWALDGVLLDSEGNPLVPGETIAITDTNFDADRDDNGKLDTIVGTNVFSPSDPQSVFDFVATQDGSSSLGVVPEPATFLLFGIGLMSIAGISRKKF